MLFNEWNVLLVDDEPDVLSVTKLALKDVHVYGLPIKIHTAQSKADAIDLLHNELAIEGVPDGSMAVAFIDVVMESDHAGLELCDYIRNRMNNHSAQLYIRTGQPGIAPERTVIDQYDISGYFTKVETTEQKLYTFVKSGIRQWYSIYYARLIAGLTNLAIENSQTKDQLLAALEPEGAGFDDGGLVSGLIFENQAVLTYQQQNQVYTLRDEMEQIAPHFQTPEGHSMVIDGNRLMVKIANTPTTAPFWYVAETTMSLPESLVEITYRNGLALSTLWKRAQ